jgi:hypothetical protein
MPTVQKKEKFYGIVCGDLEVFVNERLVHTWLKKWDKFITSCQTNTGGHKQSVHEELFSLGIALTRLFIPDENIVKSWFRSSVLHVRHDADSSVIPFEIFTDGKVLAIENMQVVRSLIGVEIRCTPRKNVENLERICISVPRSVGSPEEIEELEEMKVRNGWSILSPSWVGLASIIERLKRARFVHYAGHADETGFTSADGKKFGTEIIKSLDLSLIDSAFFNGCHTARIQKNKIKASFGYSLIASGINNYLGYDMAVHAREAVFAARCFWDNREKGISASDAVFAARKMLIKNFGLCSAAVLGLRLYVSSVLTYKKMKKDHILQIIKILIFLILMNIPFEREQNGVQKREDEVSQKVGQIEPQKAFVHIKKKYNLPTKPKQVSRFDTMAEIYLKMKHPLYDNEQKKEIIEDIKKLAASDDFKIKRLESEFSIESRK